MWIQPPSAVILRAIGFAERTMIEIAARVWPNGGQSTLQGAVLHHEVQRLVGEGLIRSTPTSPLLPGPTASSSRKRYGLTTAGRRWLEEADVDAILAACEAPTETERRTL
jgi:hypothetical protein